MNQIIFKQLGLQDYQTILHAMKQFTHTRDVDTVDEIWLLEHLPVFTQGQAGKAEHILNPHHIPIVQSDRGGQVTYHGPGQLVAYCLLDIERLGIHVRELVTRIEQSIVSLLAELHIDAHADPKAPGVYVDTAKIASIGLRVHKGRTYHGLSLNVAMDVTPFSYINPCGYAGQRVTTIQQQVGAQDLSFIANLLTKWLQHYFQ